MRISDWSSDVVLFRSPFGQRAVAVATDRAVMHEHVGAITPLNESIAFCIVEPLDGSGLALSHYHFSNSLFVIPRKRGRRSGLRAFGSGANATRTRPLPEYKTKIFAVSLFFPQFG